MWIEWHDTLLDHRKVRRLSRALSIPSVYVRGHLGTLWLRVLGQSPDGILHDWTSEDIADYSEWTGDPDLYCKALIETGWLVKNGDDLEINDWREYAGHLKVSSRKTADRDRKRKERAAAKQATDRSVSKDVQGQSCDVRVTSAKIHADLTRPDLTRPDLTGLKDMNAPRQNLALVPAAQKTLVLAKSVIALPLNNGEEHAITESDVAEWSKAYPAVDVEQTLRHMRAWLDASPGKRKTKKGIKRFVVNWLGREQDRGGGGSRASPGGYLPVQAVSKQDQATEAAMAAVEAYNAQFK